MANTVPFDVRYEARAAERREADNERHREATKHLRRVPWGSTYQRHRKSYCEACGWTPPTPKALDVDHVVPRSKGGTDDPANLRTLCPNCHRLKTLAERGLLEVAS